MAKAQQVVQLDAKGIADAVLKNYESPVLKWELRDGIEGIIQPEKGSSTYIYDISPSNIFPIKKH